MSNFYVSYITTIDLDCFDFWSGAKSRMDNATDDQRAKVYDRIIDFCDCVDEVTKTAINDLVWFDCDDIFFPEEEEEEE